MAYWATDAVFERSQSTGNARVVLLALADAVNQEAIEAGGPWEAWPSQGRLATRANCSPRAVRRALTELKRLGEIVDVGRFVGRGCRVYELSIPDPAEPRTPASTVDATVQVGQERPPGRTDASARPDASVRPGRTPASAEPEGEPEQEPDGGSPCRFPRAGERRASEAKGTQPLVDQICSILQGGLDSLSENDHGRPWPGPRPAQIAAALEVTDLDPELAIRVAKDVREIVQSQDRAPNVSGLFASRLARAQIDASLVGVPA